MSKRKYTLTVEMNEDTQAALERVAKVLKRSKASAVRVLIEEAAVKILPDGEADLIEQGVR